MHGGGCELSSPLLSSTRLEAEADPPSFNRHTNPLRPASPCSFSYSFWTRRLTRFSNVSSLLLAACQFGLSYDNGANFYVIKSYMGGCPSSTTSFDVEIPSDAPSGNGVMCVMITSFQWSCGRREDVKTDEKSACPPSASPGVGSTRSETVRCTRTAWLLVCFLVLSWRPLVQPLTDPDSLLPLQTSPEPPQRLSPALPSWSPTPAPPRPAPRPKGLPSCSSLREPTSSTWASTPV